ncbi:MAG: sugar diacid recognition domain-containing protein [Ruthenibacterium lactatiformans]
MPARTAHGRATSRRGKTHCRGGLAGAIRPSGGCHAYRAGGAEPAHHTRGPYRGAIGITGAYEQVIGYGQVVKKMTEILIREGNEQDEKRLDQRVRSRFLEDWVLGGGLLQPQVLAERGLALGVDITVPRRVMVVSVRDLARYTDTAAGQKRIDQLETAVSGLVEGEAGGIILRNAARQILLLRARPDAQMQAMAQRLCVMARERFGLRLAVGIDGGARMCTGLMPRQIRRGVRLAWRWKACCLTTV